MDDGISLPPDMVVVSGSLAFVARVAEALQSVDQEWFKLNASKYRLSCFNDQVAVYAWAVGDEVQAEDLLGIPHAAFVINLGEEYINSALRDLRRLGSKKARAIRDKQLQQLSAGQVPMFGDPSSVFPKKEKKPRKLREHKAKAARLDEMMDSPPKPKYARRRKGVQGENQSD